MSQSEYVHLEGCDILAVTDAAIQVRWEGDRYWFPKSQVADPETYEAGDKGLTVSVTEWIAEQKGIEVE